jgi:hypothetical protein
VVCNWVRRYQNVLNSSFVDLTNSVEEIQAWTGEGFIGIERETLAQREKTNGQDSCVKREIVLPCSAAEAGGCV